MIMARYANSITGFNASGKTVAAYTPVVIKSRMYAAGISDDPCFEVDTAISSGEKFIGITTCELPPGIPGKVLISGIAPALLDEIFDREDTIAPDGNGKWEYSDEGHIRVLAPADRDGIGMVFLGSRSNLFPFYRGMFAVNDISEDGKLKLLLRGGETDLGGVSDREITVPEDAGTFEIDLMAEYSDGGYTLTLSNDFNKERKSDTYALWKIASVSVKTRNNGVKYLDIIQQWHGGVIYFGSRFWI